MLGYTCEYSVYQRPETALELKTKAVVSLPKEMWVLRAELRSCGRGVLALKAETPLQLQKAYIKSEI